MLRSTRAVISLMALAAGLPCVARPAIAADIQTIVMIRHGEKPKQGLGQLDCQGLNRALALPAMLTAAFGRADAVFAPDPAHQKEDDGKPYDYVRPLATIEPTAIAAGLPVQTRFGVAETAGLRRALEQPIYRRATVLVAWEHREVEKLARMLLKGHGGDAAAVPVWRGDDFDSIYIVRLSWTGGAATASFERRQEGLDGQPTVCPK